MEKSTKRILKAKKERNYDKVQKLQQKKGPGLRTSKYPYEWEMADLSEKTTTMEDTVGYIKENFPETEEDLQQGVNSQKPEMG